MATESAVFVMLNRAFEERDEKAISCLMGQWLAYGVKISRRRQNTEIKFYYSENAKPQLVEVIKKFFPHGNLTNL